MFFSAERIKAALIRSTVINFFARVVGYIKHVAIISYLGFSYATDTFFLAMGILEFFLIVADVSDSVGVQNLVRKNENEASFKKIAASLLTFTLLLGVLLSIAIFLILPLVKLAVGNNASIEISSLSLYILLLIPYFFSTLLFRHFGAIMRSLKRFSLYFWCEFLGSSITCLIIILLLPQYANGLLLPIAFSAGQCTAALIALFFSRNYLSLSLKWDTEMKFIIRQFGQLCLLYCCTTATNIMNRFFGMLLPIKSITALTYGSMVAMAPNGIIRAESIFIVPLSKVTASMKDIDRYTVFVFSVFSFIALFLFFFSDNIIGLLFGYGRVSGIDVHLTALALKYYSISLPFIALTTLYYRIYQIAEKLPILIWMGVGSVLLQYILNVVFFRLNYGITGIALATSIVSILFTAILFIILHVRRGFFMNEKKS